MKTETPPTIAELWERFEEHIDYLGYANEPLRQQLLERCTTHDFHWLEPQSKASVVPDQWIAYHKDNAAYHAFWAWELEQRQKEKEAFND